MMTKPHLRRALDSPRTETGDAALPAARWHAVAVPTHLMPYEAAAKAIFIRANGGPAYYKATGTQQSI
ncbi:MAG: hypothetical protein HZC24_17200 [Rhodocyclales bacterium]|nr:hypothetical protein [Rhodocyclales bacterium]